MYDIKVVDDTVPYNIRKAAYDYCMSQRWYTGYRDIPPLDLIPSKATWKDVNSHPAHYSISRAPFAASEEHLPNFHKPINALFNHINEAVFDGKLVLDGLHEPSPGLKYKPAAPGPDTFLTNSVPFFNHHLDGQEEPWKEDIWENGSIAYMQAQPYETVRQTRIPHRDWKAGQGLDDNLEKYNTLMYVANLEWKPEWFGEFTMFADANEDIKGAEYKDLKFNRGVGIGWPKTVISNKPGRIVMQDGRQLHATRAVGETAPEATMHINFRVRIND